MTDKLRVLPDNLEKVVRLIARNAGAHDVRNYWQNPSAFGADVRWWGGWAWFEIDAGVLNQVDRGAIVAIIRAEIDGALGCAMEQNRRVVEKIITAMTNGISLGRAASKRSRMYSTVGRARYTYEQKLCNAGALFWRMCFDRGVEYRP